MAASWIGHQHRDDYWKQGSVCEDYSSITAAVYAVGGWADGYSNAIPRLIAGLPGPKKGLIGPWAHAYPHAAQPGPQIGFLQEALRWWDHWLKGIDTGIMDEPVLRAWMQESVPPATTYAERPGRWIAETHLAAAAPASTSCCTCPAAASPTTPGEGADVIIASSLATGVSFGEWCPYGLAGELPADQRPDDGRSVCFDTEPLSQRIEIFGAPVVTLELAADKPSAMIAARLEDVAPDGASTLVTYGLLNLTHRDGHEHPQALEPGRTVSRGDRAQRHRAGLSGRPPHPAGAGHLALADRLAVARNGGAVAVEQMAAIFRCRSASRRRPTRRCRRSRPPKRPKAEPHVITKLAGRNRTITEDPMTGEVTVTVHRERASYHLPAIDLAFEADAEEHYRIREGEPAGDHRRYARHLAAVARRLAHPH